MSVTVSVERLRVWLLAGAGLLLVVVVAFMGYAHYRAHRFLTRLPGKLGVDIRQETNGWTYSQTIESKTVYTIHAANWEQHSNGKYMLHDVGIVLYGKKQDRADRIRGKEFEFDQAAGLIRAIGEVFIDLQAPEAQSASAKMDYAAGKDLPANGTAGTAADTKSGAKEPRVIHVKTSGLVYMQKLGVAATDQEIEFTTGGLVGHAVGADYNSDTGVLILHTAVRVNGLEHERPVVLTATRAELDRPKQIAYLTNAKYLAVGSSGSGGGVGETAQAQHVTAYLRKDGSVERLQAEGAVTLTNGTGGTVTAPHGEMTLSAENHPEAASLTGGVKYLEDSLLRQGHGESADGRAVFDKAGRVQHAWANGAVHLVERVRTSDAADEAWSERELSAGAVELAMAADAAGKTGLQNAKATGNARLNVVNPATGKNGSKGTTSSMLAGDVLTAHFVGIDGKDHLSEVQGDGHTMLKKVAMTGVVNTSSGDSLVAKFRPATAGAARSATAGAKKNSARQGGDEIVSAVEQGHVVMTQMPVRKPGDTSAPQEEHATAERAVYDGELERLTLTGSVQVDDGTSVLWADRVISEQPSGDATADGSVKVSYKQAGSTDEPAHVLASRAMLKHDSQVATFFGAAGKPARLWQATSQVEAPVIELAQKQKRLSAHGQGEAMAVHTVLVSGAASDKRAGGDAGKLASSPAKTPSSPVKTRAGKNSPDGDKAQVIRIASRELVYLDDARRADFTGGVQVESADGVMRGQQVVAYLTAPVNGAASGKDGTHSSGSAVSSAAGGGMMGGSVERIVATGQIVMDQPGRRATGDQLVYTASDGMFVLTGTPGVLPKVVDQEQGTVTGVSLRFHTGDENVVVSNDGERGQRVRTVTRVKSKQ